METLDTYFPKVKNSQRGSKYLVKDPTNLDYNNKTVIVCTDCGAETLTDPKVIFWGTVPCKCGHGYYRSPERRLERLVEKVKESPFSVDFTNLPPLKTATDKVPLKCNDCSFQWSPVLNSIICDNTGCPRCASVERYSEEYYIDKINSIENLKFISKVSDKIGRQQKVTVQCTLCENLFDSLIGNIFQGKGCSGCAHYGFNTADKGYLYILSVRESGTTLGYKFGITNYPENRIKTLKKGCSYDIEPVFIFNFDNGKEAANIEAQIKKVYGKYFSKEEMKDGFTETVGVDQGKELINFIHKLVSQEDY